MGVKHLHDEMSIRQRSPLQMLHPQNNGDKMFFDTFPFSLFADTKVMLVQSAKHVRNPLSP